MPSTVPLSEFMPYGAPDLQASAPRHLSRALVSSTVLVTALFLAAGVALRDQLLENTPPIAPTVWLDPPPEIPPMPQFKRPQPEAWVRPAGPESAIPIPVVDELAPPDQTVPGRDDLRPAVPGADPDAGIQPIAPSVPGPATGELPEYSIFQYVDELPVPAIRVQPDYPDLAREAGVEGLVIVHALVGIRGRVLEVRVDPNKSVPLLDAAALAAARRWVFTPAVANGHPVAVWVAIPMRFSLDGRPR